MTMAMKQAVASTSLRNLLIMPQNPILKPNVPSSVQFPNLHKKQSNVKSNGCLKCSMDDYSNNYNQVAYPKPSEIPWKKELCNSVSLIGIVAAPVEIKHLPSGKVVAWTRLAVKKNANQTSWYVGSCLLLGIFSGISNVICRLVLIVDSLIGN